jgi:hypothetical protein
LRSFTARHYGTILLAYRGAQQAQITSMAEHNASDAAVSDRDFRLQSILASPRLNGAVVWLFAALVVVASAALIGRTVWLMDRGFDFTDQAFYLMSIQRPADYKLAYGLWAYGLKPLYELAGESVACFQRLGAVVLVGFGFVAGMVVLSEARLNWRQPAGIQILAVCAALPHVALVPEANDEVVEAVLAVDFHDVPEDRSSADLDHRLRADAGLFGQTSAHSAGEDHSFHRSTFDCADFRYKFIGCSGSVR